jgi:flagellar assembly protein FliH
MSSSPSRAPSRPSDAIPAQREQAEASPFPYSEVAVSPSPHDPSVAGLQVPGGRKSESDPSKVAQAADREAHARAMGRQQGELESRTKFEEQLGRERSAVAAALTDFARDRAAYYQKIEEEAVRLALSIARKILHREAQVDPLLLMGIVRVALERIEGATGVVLAVHPQQAADWRRYLAAHMDAGAVPEIVEDAALPPDRCTLRTSMGTAELGLEVQLKEIEQGLMDLLAARPQDKP